MRTTNAFWFSGLVHGSASLLTEMELSDSERSLNASRRPFSEIEEEDDVECDNPDPVSMTAATGEIKEVQYELIVCLTPNSKFCLFTGTFRKV